MKIDLVIRAAQIIAALEESHEGALEAVLGGDRGSLESDAVDAVLVALRRLADLGVDVHPGVKGVKP
jgi:hypothetical protein